MVTACGLVVLQIAYRLENTNFFMLFLLFTLIRSFFFAAPNDAIVKLLGFGM